MTETALAYTDHLDSYKAGVFLGEHLAASLQALRQQLGSIDYVGCNTHGQIARAEGEFHGFHNCTAVVCVIPA